MVRQFLLLLTTIIVSCNSSQIHNNFNKSDSSVLKQNKQYNFLKEKIKNADTVLLISHAHLDEIIFSGKGEEVPPLLINGKLNRKVIKEQKIITQATLDTFISILLKPLENNTVETRRCFTPHHSVIIINKNSSSYIDLCFQCRNFETSKDLEMLDKFDEEKWSRLILFFKNLGFKYKMP
jgi:hypothetical protein